MKAESPNDPRHRYTYAVHTTTGFHNHHVSDLETCCTFLLCYCTLTFPAYLLAELPSFLPLHFFFLYTAIRRCLCFLSRTFTDTCTQYLLLGKKREPHILTTSILTLTVICWISKSVSLCPSQVLWRNGTLYKRPLLVSLVFITSPSARSFIMTF